MDSEEKSSAGLFFPVCSFCKLKVFCSKTALLRHMKSSRHIEAARMSSVIQSNQPRIDTVLGAPDKDVAGIEIKIACFIAKNNLPLDMSEDLLTLMTSLFSSDKALQKVTLGKQKATNVIRKVLGFQF